MDTCCSRLINGFGQTIQRKDERELMRPGKAPLIDLW